MDEQENEYFERDYRVKEEKKKETEFKNFKKEEFKAFQDVIMKAPKHIISEDKEAFEYLRERSDSFARAEHCRVAAWVDYEKYEAWIQVICPFFEFETPKRREYLKDVAEKAEIITFQMKDDEIELRIYIPYFEDEADEATEEKAWEALFDKMLEEDSEDMSEIAGLISMNYPEDMD